MLEHLIPNKKQSAARGGSARTNALAIDQLISNALNKQNNKTNQVKKKKKRSRKSPLRLNLQQSALGIPTVFFNVMQGSTPGGVRVRGREIVKTVSSGAGGAFTINSTALSPQLCPRLSSYSPIYEMYVFHSAKAIFQSNQPTTATGVAAIATDYDAKDTAPTNMVDMMRNISSSMSNIYADNACFIDKRLSRLPKYNIVEDSSQDLSQVIQATVHFATEGGPETAVIGYLFFEYDVEFFTPQ